MEREFTEYAEALALKELGFDEKCYGYFTKDKEFFYFDVDDLSSAYTKNMDNLVVNSVNGLECTAPLYQQAFRWFREEYGIFVGPTMISYEDGPYLWSFEINTLPFGTDLGECPDSKTYEEAELACLKKLIQIVKNK